MKASRQLGIAVVGVGRIGRMHARIIAEQLPNAYLAGIYDISADSAGAVAAEFGVVAAHSIDELLASPDVDALAICTATPTHSELIIKAAAAGKAVFCEKPISMSLTDVDAAIAATEAARVPFMVGFNRRFDPGHAAIQQAARAGELGQLTIARITSRDPAPPPIEYIQVSGGIWADMLIHDFDMASFIIGSPVVQVWAQGAALFDIGIREAGDFDTAVAVLTHASGAITTIDASRKAVYGYDQRVEVFGTAGMAISDNQRVNYAQIYREESSQLSALPYFFLERYEQSFRNEWLAFTNYALHGGPSPVSGADGRAPVAIAMAAALSARHGRAVNLDEIN
ncbi:MAG: inositol 2-dehydrogenase [Candidatus Nanopelagicales bacterium]|nr:inositol 2-dehydrogenase [Candidatus Nanopelagicales bacterium]